MIAITFLGFVLAALVGLPVAIPALKMWRMIDAAYTARRYK